MPPSGPAAPRWLAVCRHHVRGFGAPYLLILQHPIVASATRIAAPVVSANGARANLLAPRVTVTSMDCRAILLDMASVPLTMIGPAVAEAAADEDAINDGLDAIFRGYPVGLPGGP